jgi:hypothetical protein
MFVFICAETPTFVNQLFKLTKDREYLTKSPPPIKKKVGPPTVGGLSEKIPFDILGDHSAPATQSVTSSHDSSSECEYVPCPKTDSSSSVCSEGSASTSVTKEEGKVVAVGKRERKDVRKIELLPQTLILP